MKIAIRTIFFHLSCIMVFAMLYLYFSSHFDSNNDNNQHNSFIDFLLLSTTVQAGVGISDLYPISFYGKIVMIAQQILMLSTHVFTLYIFTL